MSIKNSLDLNYFQDPIYIHNKGVKQQKRADRFPLWKNEVHYVGQSVTLSLNKTAEKAVPCCTLVILGMQTIGFLFEKE